MSSYSQWTDDAVVESGKVYPNKCVCRRDCGADTCDSRSEDSLEMVVWGPTSSLDVAVIGIVLA